MCGQVFEHVKMHAGVGDAAGEGSVFPSIQLIFAGLCEPLPRGAYGAEELSHGLSKNSQGRSGRGRRRSPQDAVPLGCRISFDR